MEQLLDQAAGVLPDVVDLRRRIHSDPELGLQLPLTQAHGARRARRAAGSRSAPAPR